MHAGRDDLQLQSRHLANAVHHPAQTSIICPGSRSHADFSIHPLHNSINSSGAKSRDAARPMTSSQRIGDNPVPGRLAVRFELSNISPARIARAAISDLRAIGLFFASLALGRLMPSPKACSMLRIATIIALSSKGSRLAL